MVPESSNVEAFFQSGAGFGDVAKTHERSSNLVKAETVDSIEVICGTNDVFTTPWETIECALNSLSDKFGQCKQFCLIGISQRFDGKKLNFHISRLNMKIRNFVKSAIGIQKFATLIPLNFLKSKTLLLIKFT